MVPGTERLLGNREAHGHRALWLLDLDIRVSCAVWRTRCLAGLRAASLMRLATVVAPAGSGLVVEVGEGTRRCEQTGGEPLPGGTLHDGEVWAGDKVSTREAISS